MKRWSAKRKREVVLRLLRGETVDEVSREVKVLVHQLEEWRERFLESGLEGLKSRGDTSEAAELKEARAKIGELTMELELAREALEKSLAVLPGRRPGQGGNNERGHGSSLSGGDGVPLVLRERARRSGHMSAACTAWGVPPSNWRTGRGEAEA